MLSKGVSSALVVILMSASILAGTLSTQTEIASAQTNWTKYGGNPVLNPGASGEWDDAGVSYQAVIKDSSAYKMWYSGSNGSSYSIGYATSPDGTSWTKYASNPVLSLGSLGEWDSIYIMAPTAILDGPTYKMWYCGFDGSSYRIGYATSSNGIAWTKYAGNPVLDLGSSGEWDERWVVLPTVIKSGGSYRMWFTGVDSSFAFKIGYATSSDGVTWQKYGANPVLSPGGLGQWDSSSVYSGSNSVIFDAGTYRFWYTGIGTLGYAFGYATSPDGTSWSKYASNPVLKNGTMGDWDSGGIILPSVLNDGTYKMWYAGHRMGNFQIGYAIESGSVNNPPVLSWTGEPNYMSDGLNPENGDTATSFEYRIKYTDVDNDPPLGNDPKVHIRKGGLEIPGSPFSMAEVDPSDTTYDDGKLYKFITTLGLVGNDYSYYFTASNTVGQSAAPTLERFAPNVFPGVNNAPALAWTGETGYLSDGLDPETGTTASAFIYRVNYSDADNNPPQTGHPKVYVQKPLGSNIAGSPFKMREVDPADTNYVDGKLYTYSAALTTGGTDYRYFFNATDGSQWATGSPTGAVDAPDVTIAKGTIKGEVSGENTESISGATVTLKNSVTDTKTTDSDGVFDFDDLEADEYTIEVRKAGYEDYSDTVTLEPGEVLDLSITLKTLKGSIKGKVVDDQGKPVKGAIVELLDENGNKLLTRTTGSDGEFNYQDLELGTYKIRVSKGGFEGQTKGIELTQATPDADIGTLTLRPPFPWWILILAIVVIVVLILMVLLLVRRKRKAPAGL